MLFKDQILQKKLEEDGFVTLQLLNKVELEALNDFYNQIHNNQEPPDFIDNIHMTIWCSDREYKLSIKSKLEELFHDPTRQLFSDCRSLNHVLIVKRSGSETTFKVHQDWNVVDEAKYQSVNVWVPLHDVNKDGGALWVVKGSHKINRPVRGAGYLFPDYSSHIRELEKVATSVNLKAGEAIIFYHSIIHGSPPNLANTHRKAACFTVIPNEAPLCIYFQKDSLSNLERHEPKDDFMFNYTHLRSETYTKTPTEKAISVLPAYLNRKVELSELDIFLRTKKNFWQKLGFK